MQSYPSLVKCEQTHHRYKLPVHSKESDTLALHLCMAYALRISSPSIVLRSTSLVKMPLRFSGTQQLYSEGIYR
jgi:hypothetical protein